jgi:hypothetical protein
MARTRHLIFVKKLVTTLRRYHTIEIQVGPDITAADPYPTTFALPSTVSTARKNRTN